MTNQTIAPETENIHPKQTLDGGSTPSISSDLKKRMENLGYGDLSINDFIKLEIPSSEDQSRASQIIEAQSIAKECVERERASISNDDLIERISKNTTDDLFQEAIQRIVQLKTAGKPVKSEKLQKQLKDAVKSAGVAAKTVEDEIKREIKREIKSQEKGIAATDLPFSVLGFNIQRKVLIWCKGSLMHVPVMSLESELDLLFGLQSCEISRVKEEVRKKGIVDEEMPIRVGIWQLPEWKKEGKILIISGRGGVFFEKGEFTQLDGPIVDGQIVQFERQSWVDLKQLQNNTNDLNKTFNELRDILIEWPWKWPDAADWMAAFIMLMPFQQLMRWRPWLWLDGPSNCGKSAFFDELLENLFQKLVARADKSTGHALIQVVGNSCKIPALDEFEKYKHNDDVLNTCKVMNRGGTKTSGTTGQTERSFNLHHMPVFGSIYLPRTLVTDQSQRNRIVRFSLNKVTKRKKVIPPENLHNLGARITASMIPVWPKVESLAREISSETTSIVESFEGELSSRSVDNFQYAAAILRIVNPDQNYTVPEWARQEQVDDERTILEAIIRSKIRCNLGGDFLVQDLIELACGEPIEIAGMEKSRAEENLRINGLKVVDSRDGTRRLAIRPETVTKYILKDEDAFRGLDISEPLLRMSTAKKVKTSWGSGSSGKEWAIQIPISEILPDDDDTEIEDGGTDV